MEELKGIISEVIFHNEENGYSICEMETDEELVTIVGTLPSCSKGTSLLVRGTFKVHPRYGEQFAFTEAEEVLPTSRAGIEGFLASGIIKGIGKKTALAIVSTFGEESLKIIENEPSRLTEVPGIGQKSAQKIASAYGEHREFANVSVFFQSYGVPVTQALKLYKAYGKDAVAIIKENPYRLIDEVWGIGFHKADMIAEKLGIERDSAFRIASGIKHGLRSYVNDGSTFAPKEELCERVADLLEVTREQVQDELVQLAFSGDIKVDVIDGRTVIYLYPYYEAEQKVCRCISTLCASPLKVLAADVDSSINMTEKESGISLSERQKNAVKKSLLSGVSIITGGPGTGKTTIINALINIFEEGGLKVALAAPTGRASKRMTEATGHPASTVHRLLEYYFDDGIGDMRFGKTSEDPLKCDAVIVDEASMIDLMLMKGLTDAISPGTRLVLVGDADQLPSVGAGNVLHDMIESGIVQTARLTEIFRQAEESMIVVNAHRINHGERPSVNGKGTDFFFMPRRNEEEMRDLIVELATRRLGNYYTELDPLGGIQILTPVHKGTVGTKALNEVLQAAFNPPEETRAEKKFGDHIFRVGDKVMQTRNNYQLEWKRLGEAETHQGVFNGDVGFIRGIDNESGTMTVCFDDDRFAEYDFTMLDELELAYAVTVHKSQGSEFPIVVMPVSWFPPMLATRNLLYTAITRGKKAVVLVGSEKSMYAMIDNDRIKLRWSGLASRLSDMVPYTE